MPTRRQGGTIDWPRRRGHRSLRKIHTVRSVEASENNEGSLFEKQAPPRDKPPEILDLWIPLSGHPVSPPPVY